MKKPTIDLFDLLVKLYADQMGVSVEITYEKEGEVK